MGKFYGWVSKSFPQKEENKHIHVAGKEEISKLIIFVGGRRAVLLNSDLPGFLPILRTRWTGFCFLTLPRSCLRGVLLSWETTFAQQENNTCFQQEDLIALRPGFLGLMGFYVLEMSTWSPTCIFGNAVEGH